MALLVLEKLPEKYTYWLPSTLNELYHTLNRLVYDGLRSGLPSTMFIGSSFTRTGCIWLIVGCVLLPSYEMLNDFCWENRYCQRSCGLWLVKLRSNRSLT